MRILKSSGIFLVAVAVCILLASCSGNGPADFARWIMNARDGSMIGGYGDNFVYDGSDSRIGTGQATINVDPDKDTGTLEATWNGTHTPEDGVTVTGQIRIVIKTWSGAPAFMQGGIAEDVQLHGATGQGGRWSRRCAHSSRAGGPPTCMSTAS